LKTKETVVGRFSEKKSFGAYRTVKNEANSKARMKKTSVLADGNSKGGAAQGRKNLIKRILRKKKLGEKKEEQRKGWGRVRREVQWGPEKKYKSVVKTESGQTNTTLEQGSRGQAR